MLLTIIITTLGSVIGLGIVGKLTVIAGDAMIKQIYRRNIKGKLKKKLSKKIDDIDFNGFLDTIYEIKNYDIKYNKHQYNKLKYHYKFNEKILCDKNLFLQRFDPNYEIADDLFTRQIRYEIELSLKKLRSDFGNLL